MSKFRTKFRHKPIGFPNKVLIIVILLFLILYIYIDYSIRPFIREFAIDDVEEYAYFAINNAVIDDMNANSDNYIGIATLKTNSQDQLVALETDTYKINQIKTNIMTLSEENLQLDKLTKIYIPIGNIYNNLFLFSKGFELPVRIIPMTTTKVEFVSSFTSQGINQSLHRIIMECEIEIKLMTPFDEIDFSIYHEIALSETLILGEVPNSYTYINTNDLPQNLNYYLE